MKRLTAGSSACQALISAQSPGARLGVGEAAGAGEPGLGVRLLGARPADEADGRVPAPDQRIVAAADLAGEGAGDVAEGGAGEGGLGHQVRDRLGEAEPRVAGPDEAERVEFAIGAGKAGV